MLLPVLTLGRRELTRFFRQRSRVIGAFVQPLVFWLLVGAGFRASFRPPGVPGGTSYAEYAYPGILAMVLLFTAIFSTISVVEDRRAGFLQGVLVAPVGRATIVLGQALGEAYSATQGWLIDNGYVTAEVDRRRVVVERRLRAQHHRPLQFQIWMHSEAVGDGDRPLGEPRLTTFAADRIAGEVGVGVVNDGAVDAHRINRQPLKIQIE